MKMNRVKILPAISVSVILSLAALTAKADVLVQENGFMPEKWDGAYFGAYFAAGSGNFRSNLTIPARTTSISFGSDEVTLTQIITSDSHNFHSNNATASMANLFVGYNFHPCCALFLLGAQLEGSFYSHIFAKVLGTRTINATITTIVIPPDGPATSETINQPSSFGAENTERLASTFAAIIRGGYLVTPQMLLYALAGPVEGNFLLQGPATAFRRSIWKMGYTAGGGLEYKFNNHWSMLGEYRYYHFQFDRHRTSFFQQQASSINTIAFRTQNTSHIRSRLNLNMGLIGVVYRFDPVMTVFG